MTTRPAPDESLTPSVLTPEAGAAYRRGALLPAGAEWTIGAAPTPVPAQRMGWNAIALAAAIFAAHAPLLALHLLQQWPKEHYQYMPLAPFAAWALAARRIRSAGSFQAERSGRVVAMFAFGVFLLSAAVLFLSPWLCVAALLANTLGLVFLIGGAGLFRVLLPAWVFLALLLPLPFGWDAPLLTLLQRITVRCSAAIFEWAGGLCLVTGAVVQLRGQTLFVAGACSGVQSLFATLTCTLFYLFWFRRGWAHGTLLLLAAGGWVMAANIARVLVILFFSRPGSWDLTQGAPHQVLGVLTFSLAILLVLSTDQLLMIFQSTRRRGLDGEEDAAATVPSAWPVPHLSTGVARPLVLVFAFFALVSGGVLAMKSQFSAGGLAYQFDVPTLQASQLPAQIGEWRQVRFQVVDRGAEDVQAAHSQTWAYTNGAQNAIVSLDYPYPDVHDLQPCYENTGWLISDRQTLGVPATRTPPGGEYVQLRLQQGTDRHGYVAYSAFTVDGQPATLGRVLFLNSLQTRFFDVFRERLFGGSRRLRPSVYQVQLFSDSLAPWTPQQIKQLDDLLFESRQKLAAPNFKIPGF